MNHKDTKDTKIVGAGLPEMVTNYLSGKPIKPALWCHAQVPKGGFYIKIILLLPYHRKTRPYRIRLGIGIPGHEYSIVRRGGFTANGDKLSIRETDQTRPLVLCTGLQGRVLY